MTMYITFNTDYGVTEIKSVTNLTVPCCRNARQSDIVMTTVPSVTSLPCAVLCCYNARQLSVVQRHM